MSDDQILQLFKLIQEKAKIDALEDNSTAEHLNIKGAVVDLGVKIDDYNQELSLHGHQLDSPKAEPHIS